MASVLWKDTHLRNNAQMLIDWLLSEEGATGWTWNVTNSTAFSELMSSGSHENLDRTVAQHILHLMRDQQKTTVKDFEILFHQLRCRQIREAEMHAACWKFFLPVRMTLHPDLEPCPEIRVLGQEFSLCPDSSVRADLHPLDQERLGNLVRMRVRTGVNIQASPQVYIAAANKGHTWQMAWDNTTPAFDALRGMIEFDLAYHRWQVTFGGKNPLRRIPHPLWMLARQPQEEAEWITFITEEPSQPGFYDKKTMPFEVTNQWFNRFRDKATYLKNEASSETTASLIAECFRLYSQAFDYHFGYQRLLGFWQLAEAITRAEPGRGASKQVIKRLAWHGPRIGLKGSGYLHSLKAYSRVRNNIAHRGIHRVHDDDIHTLKIACETALNWLIQNVDSLPTKHHVDEFYRLRTANSAQLQAAKESVEFVQTHNAT